MVSLWRSGRYVVGPALLALALVRWPSASAAVPMALIAMVWIVGVGVASVRSLRGGPTPGTGDAGSSLIGSTYTSQSQPQPPGHHHHGGGFIGGGHAGGHGGHGGH